MKIDPRHPLVLVVDDDADTRELYQILLESVGYRVQAAGTVARGIDLACRATPDVALTDWRLPDGDGFSVADAFRERTALRHVPLVAVSGLSFRPEALDFARTRGFVEMLVKPASPDAILRAVRSAREYGTSQQLRAAAVRLRRYGARVLKGTKAATRTTEQGPSDGANAGVLNASVLLERAAARSAGGITLMLADDSAHYVAAGGSTRELTGYDPQELVSLSVWDLTQPLDATSAQGLWGSFIVSGTQEGRYTLRRRDGAPVEAQYCAIANVIPGFHVSAIAEASQLPDSL